MQEVAVLPRPAFSGLTRTVGIATSAFLLVFAAAALATGQQSVWLGNLAQIAPPMAYAALAVHVARRCAGQVRVFWNLNAIFALTWAAGQIVRTYYDVVTEPATLVSASDPIFFMSSIPLAAALYGRPDRDRPRWLFDIALLDIVLIALFAAFLYLYFIVSLDVTNGPQDVYHANVRHLFNGRNLFLMLWAAHVWRSAISAAWRRVLGIYCVALSVAFVLGVLYSGVQAAAPYRAGTLWDLCWMAPYGLLALAAAKAYDERLFTPPEAAPRIAHLPVVSLIAVALLVWIPTTAEIVPRLFGVPPAAEALRTRLALTMMIPFGIVVVLREFLSRRALLRAGEDLVEAREQLAQREKLAAVGQLVSGVAHELNNPLQGVLGYAELMSLNQREPQDAAELRAIQESATRAAGIVRNLLAFAGRDAPTRTWQQVNAVVEEAVSRHAPSLRRAGIDVHVNLAERLPLIYLDAQRFGEVLSNLIENAQAAIASRQASGGTSAVHASERGEITIETRRSRGPDRIVVEIGDDGPGVRTEDLTRIFDPFFTTKKDGEGRGLGLSVCYGIVREHGGLIHAHNRGDTGGAVFAVELPISADAYGSSEESVDRPAGPPASVPAHRDASVAPRNARALVVDDEDSNATLVRRALEMGGYSVESTTLSRRALVMIERTPYDVVIADVRMPELSGQELYSRACQIRPEMARRFIFVTGDIDGQDTLEFLAQSRCGYFMKPFNLERLTTAVDMLVIGHRGDVTS